MKMERVRSYKVVVKRIVSPLRTWVFSNNVHEKKQLSNNTI